MSRRINSIGSISRATILDIVNSSVSVTYTHYGVLHEQYLVNARFHLGPRILLWSRGEETKQSVVYFPTGISLDHVHREFAKGGNPGDFEFIAYIMITI